MKLIDISWPLSPTITGYRGKRSLALRATQIFSQDHTRNTNVAITTHTGTHVDAPAHFLNKGKTIEKIPLESLSGRCIVLNLTHITKKITRKDLEKQRFRKGDIVLFKTKNSDLLPTEHFHINFVYVESSAAQYLVKKGIKAVGIDYLGIEHDQKKHPTHKIFLRKNIPVIEGLRLKHVRAGKYNFICLPLAFIGLEAAPARAVLFK